MKRRWSSAGEKSGAGTGSFRPVHEQGSQLPISEDTIRELHRLTRGGIGDAGQYKEKDSNSLERVIEESKDRYYEAMKRSSKVRSDGIRALTIPGRTSITFSSS